MVKLFIICFFIGIIGGIIKTIYNAIMFNRAADEPLEIDITPDNETEDILYNDILESYETQLESLTTALNLLTESYKNETNTTKKAAIMGKIASTQEKINKVNQKQYKLLEKLDI